MLYTTNAARAQFKNRHHFSKESFSEMFSSHVLTQGSPLLVGTFTNLNNSEYDYTIIPIYRISFTQQHTGFNHAEYLGRYWMVI